MQMYGGPHGGGGGGERSVSSGGSTAVEEEAAVVEMLLEAYFMQLGHTWQRLQVGRRGGVGACMVRLSRCRREVDQVG